jgi:DNA-binding Lrp family transcriptional regulator
MLEKNDREIILELKKNGRDSFREIAKRLDVHPTTLIKRVERLVKAGVIRGYGAHVDLLAMGYEFMAMIDMRISKGHLLEVENKLRSQPGVVAIYDVTGDYDAMVLVACKSRGEFSKIVKHMLAESYVERTNTHVILNIIKNEYEFMPQ